MDDRDEYGQRESGRESPRKSVLAVWLDDDDNVLFQHNNPMVYVSDNLDH